LNQINNSENSSPSGQDELPELPPGIVSLEAKGFRLQSFQTLTGLKIFVTAAPLVATTGDSSSNSDRDKNTAMIIHQHHLYLDKILLSVYRLYSDYVLKNPFYKLDMPIRFELFDEQIIKLINGPPTK